MIDNTGIFMAVFALLSIGFAVIAGLIIIGIISLFITVVGDAALLMGAIIGLFVIIFGVCFAVGIMEHFDWA
jgi:hypothetical protein